MHEHKNSQPRDLDPIRRSFSEAPDFNRSWLTAQRPLKNQQRLGFTVVSAFMGLGGAMFISAGIANLREMNIMCLAFLIPGLACLYFGLHGLWRVLKDVFFRKSSAKDDSLDS